MEKMENLNENNISAFIVGTCQLLPKKDCAVFEPIHCVNEYVIHCGSTRELYIRPLNSCADDVDALMLRGNELAIAEGLLVLPIDVSGLHDTIRCFRIEPCLRHPGFVRLRVLGIMNYNWKYKRYEFSHTTDLLYYWLNIAGDVAALHPTREGAKTYTARGPAITIQYYPEHFPFNDRYKSVQRPKESQSSSKRPRDHAWPTIDTSPEWVHRGHDIRYVQNSSCSDYVEQWRDDGPDPLTYDSVPSQWCPQWPKEAQEWPIRPREYGWPTIDTISEVIQQGCHVVYAQHRDCNNDKLQWRLSFSVAEVILLESWTQTQQIVSHLLRFIAKRELIQKDCSKEDEVLCTYHLKTLMLWTCEDVSSEWWNSSSVIAICSQLLQKLSEWLKRRYCPNYFIPEANLFNETLSSTVLYKIKRQLNKFCNSGILCQWLLENYIQPFTGTNIEDLDLAKCMLGITEVQKPLQSVSLNLLFSDVFMFCNNIVYNRQSVNSKTNQPRSSLSQMRSFRKITLLADERMSKLPIPVDVSCFTCLDKTVYCLNAAYSLSCGELSLEGELFEYVRGICLKRKIVRCQHHIFPEPLTAEKSQCQFLRAQELMENLTGFNSRSEFQLLSLMSTEFLSKALQCEDSQSKDIAPAALVYLAALHFATSEYQTVIDLCSTVLMGETIPTETETLNAGCLFFINDVVRIVGFCLLCKKLNQKMHYNKSQIYLDLRLTAHVFAYCLTVTSAERISKQFELNLDLPTSEFPFDHFMLASAKQKSGILIQSRIGLKAPRQCVYRRTDSLIVNATLSMDPLIATKKVIDYLTDYAFENMISFYSVIRRNFCIQCNADDCYRALYLYKCRKYDEVVHLCEEILKEPDLQSDLKELAFANVLVMPPLESFFDRDIQSLVGFHTLFYFLSPLNDDLRKFKFGMTFSHRHFRVKSLLRRYPVTSYHFLGRHFLARYLKLRCYIECNYPCGKALAEFAATKNSLSFEHIIRRFLLQRHRKIQ